MGAWEALRRTLSTIYGREVTDDDASIIKIYPKGSAPTTGDNLFPVYAFTPNTCPPGYEYYTDTSGNIAIKCLHNTSGALTISETGDVYTNDPYNSDGAAGRTPSIMEAYTQYYSAQADGSVVSAELLPAAGAGLKWVLWDILTSCRVSLTGGTGGRLTLSDMTATKGGQIEFPIYGQMLHPGPYKQGTANTAINVSAAAGLFTNSTSSICISFRAAKVA